MNAVHVLDVNNKRKSTCYYRKWSNYHLVHLVLVYAVNFKAAHAILFMFVVALYNIMISVYY